MFHKDNTTGTKSEPSGKGGEVSKVPLIQTHSEPLKTTVDLLEENSASQSKDEKKKNRLSLSQGSIIKRRKDSSPRDLKNKNTLASSQGGVSPRHSPRNQESTSDSTPQSRGSTPRQGSGADSREPTPRGQESTPDNTPRRGSSSRSRGSTPRKGSGAGSREPTPRRSTRDESATVPTTPNASTTNSSSNNSPSEQPRRNSSGGKRKAYQGSSKTLSTIFYGKDRENRQAVLVKVENEVQVELESMTSMTKAEFQQKVVIPLLSHRAKQKGNECTGDYKGAILDALNELESKVETQISEKENLKNYPMQQVFLNIAKSITSISKKQKNRENENDDKNEDKTKEQELKVVDIIRAVPKSIRKDIKDFGKNTINFAIPLTDGWVVMQIVENKKFHNDVSLPQFVKRYSRDTQIVEIMDEHIRDQKNIRKYNDKINWETQMSIEVKEYLPNCSIPDLVENEDDPNERAKLAMTVGLGLCNIVDDLIDQKIVWSDLKWGNLLFTHGEVKISDIKGFLYLKDVILRHTKQGQLIAEYERHLVENEYSKGCVNKIKTYDILQNTYTHYVKNKLCKLVMSALSEDKASEEKDIIDKFINEFLSDESKELDRFLLNERVNASQIQKEIQKIKETFLQKLKEVVCDDEEYGSVVKALDNPEETLSQDILSLREQFNKCVKYVIESPNKEELKNKLEKIDDPEFLKTLLFLKVNDISIKCGYDLFVMSADKFDQLKPDEKNKPCLVITKKADEDQYKIWGFKDNRWQFTELDHFKLPPAWANKVDKEDSVYISESAAICATLNGGHTLTNEGRSLASKRDFNHATLYQLAWETANTELTSLIATYFQKVFSDVTEARQELNKQLTEAQDLAEKARDSFWEYWQYEYRFKIGVILYQICTKEVILIAHKERDESYDFDFDQPVFKGEMGSQLEKLIKGLCHSEPEKRISIEEARQQLTELQVFLPGMTTSTSLPYTGTTSTSLCYSTMTASTSMTTTTTTTTSLGPTVSSPKLIRSLSVKQKPTSLATIREDDDPMKNSTRGFGNKKK